MVHKNALIIHTHSHWFNFTRNGTLHPCYSLPTSSPIDILKRRTFVETTLALFPKPWLRRSCGVKQWILLILRRSPAFSKTFIHMITSGGPQFLVLMFRQRMHMHVTKQLSLLMDSCMHSGLVLNCIVTVFELPWWWWICEVLGLCLAEWLKRPLVKLTHGVSTSWWDAPTWFPREPNTATPLVVSILC